MPATYGGRCSQDTIRCGVFLIGTGPLGVVGMLSAAILALCPGCRKPPDLSACTRLDVQYDCGALRYFFPDSFWRKSVLSEEEREYVRSYDAWTATDQPQIKAFAYAISQGTYQGRAHGTTETLATVVGYRGSERTASFTVHGRSIITGSKTEFVYPWQSPGLTNLDPPGLEPLRARWRCCENLSRLVLNGLWQGGPYRNRVCPDPNHWCDVIVTRCRGRHTIGGELNNKIERTKSDTAIARMFTCPSTHGSVDANEAPPQRSDPTEPNQAVSVWKSDYALNPNCGKDSPGDMVFLFESRPGWNQHGGPELSTFDNHDPKGGLVLLNDGTVKFIRTEEELKQLRWK